MGTELNSRYLTLPAVAMRGIVLFPSMVLHFDVGREKSILPLNRRWNRICGSFWSPKRILL